MISGLTLARPTSPSTPTLHRVPLPLLLLLVRLLPHLVVLLDVPAVSHLLPATQTNMPPHQPEASCVVDLDALAILPNHPLLPILPQALYDAAPAALARNPRRPTHEQRATTAPLVP